MGFAPLISSFMTCILLGIKGNCPGSSPLSKKTFLRDIRRVLDKINVWDCPEVAVKVGQKMNLS